MNREQLKEKIETILKTDYPVSFKEYPKVVANQLLSLISQDREELAGKIEKIIERVVLQEAVIKFNSTPEIGEKFDPERHNHTNKLLNEMNSFIYQELKGQVLSIIKKQ